MVALPVEWPAAVPVRVDGLQMFRAPGHVPVFAEAVFAAEVGQVCPTGTISSSSPQTVSCRGEVSGGPVAGAQCGEFVFPGSLAGFPHRPGFVEQFFAVGVAFAGAQRFALLVHPAARGKPLVVPAVAWFR